MSIIKKGIKDSLIYGSGVSLVNFSRLGSLYVLTHKLKASSYAILALILVLIPIFRTIVSLEISQSATIFFSDANNYNEKRDYFSTGFWFSCVCLLSILLFVIGVYWFLYSLDYLSHPISIKNILIISVAILFDSLSYYNLIIIRWREYARYYSFCCVSIAWLTLFVLWLEVWKYHAGLDGVFKAWLVAWGIGFVFAALKNVDLYKFRFSWGKLRKMLSFSFPLFLNNIPDRLNAMVDRYVILFLLSVVAVGCYSAAYSIANIAALLPSVIQLTFWPLIYKSATKGAEYKKEILLLFRVGVVIVGSLSCIFIVLSKDLLTLFVGPHYLDNKSIFIVTPIVMMSILITSFQSFFPGMAVAKKNYYTLFSTLLSLSANVLFGILGAVFFGIIGVAIGMLLATVIQLLSYVYFSQKFYSICFTMADLFLWIALVILCGIAFAINIFSPGFSLTELVYKSAFIAFILISATAIYYKISLFDRTREVA